MFELQRLKAVKTSALLHSYTPELLHSLSITIHGIAVTVVLSWGAMAKTWSQYVTFGLAVRDVRTVSPNASDCESERHVLSLLNRERALQLPSQDPLFKQPNLLS